MALTPTTRKLTFKEYLTYDDGTDNRYELEDGELILMNPPTGRHALVVRLLNNAFEAEISRQNLPWVSLQVIGVRTAPRRSRLPDLCVVPLEVIQECLDVSAVIESGALLVVEIVSPDSVTRDYRFKRAEYASFGIPEYWIVDPTAQKVTVLQLVEGLYEDVEYRGGDRVQSQILSELALTVEQILQT
jgi:Uma2 family endonuclease